MDLKGRRGSVLIIALVVAVVLAAAGGVWYWMLHNPGARSSGSHPAAPTTAATSTTYMNGEYGVIFTYPNAWTTKMGDTAEGDYGLNTQYYPGSVSLVTVEMPTDSYPGSGFSGAYFNLSVNKNLSSGQCFSINSQPRNGGREGTTTIGGVAFRWGEEGGVAAGSYSFSRYYTGYAHGTCYEFNLGDAGGSNVSLNGTPGPSYAGDMAVLEGLLPSVAFTGAAQAPQ